MNTSIPLARLAVAAALALLSNPSFALDLMDSYRKALAADPTMLAANEAVQAGREKAVQGAALLKPRVSLTAGYSRIDDRSSGSSSLPPPLTELVRTQASSNAYQAGVHLVQPLYNLKAAAEKKQLQQHTELSEIGFRDAQQELMQRVSETYFGVLLAEENLRVGQAEKAAVGMQRDRARARFDVGREAFVERTVRFVEHTGGVILEQLKAIGASCDWTRNAKH